MNKEYKRKCPICKNIIFYKKKENRNLAELKKTYCCKRSRLKHDWGGQNNPMYGKKHTPSARQKCREARQKQIIPEEQKVNFANYWIGKNRTDKNKQNSRLGAIKRIEESKGQCIPNYNPKSIPILEQKAKELGITDFQHAENGGEYRIPKLGYFVDLYNPSTNTVMEYLEKYHLKQIEKDERRKQEITNHLNCNYIEIKEWEIKK